MKVIALPKADKYLQDLVSILYQKEYFGFKECAQKYVDNLIFEIETTLPTRLHKPAPKHFDKYGKSMKYAVFRKSKNTYWYVFFKAYKEKGETVYLIRYIGNNHTVAQYM